MIFEHFAINVSDSTAMARWYVHHLGFCIVRDVGGPARTVFLGDETGRTVLELYSNFNASVPDYAAQHPLVFHFAVVTPDAQGLRTLLEKQGAVYVEQVCPPDGSVLIMMRDPWGVALQLCQRATPMPT